MFFRPENFKVDLSKLMKQSEDKKNITFYKIHINNNFLSKSLWLQETVQENTWFSFTVF